MPEVTFTRVTALGPGTYSSPVHVANSVNMAAHFDFSLSPAFEWLNSHIHELCLAVVYALAIYTLLTFFVRKFQGRRMHVECTSNDGTGRKLGVVESALDQIHKYGGAVQISAVLLKSKMTLPPASVRKALEALSQRHPLLRMRISEVKAQVRGKLETLRYFREMDNSKVVQLTLKNKPATQWAGVLEKELLKPLETGTGPLWRVVMLKEEISPQEGWHRNTLLFIEHCAISDGLSALHLCNEFTENLRILHTSQSPRQELSVESLPLRQPVHELLTDHLTLSQLDTILLIFKDIWSRWVQRIVARPRNQFTAVFPPISLQDPSIPKKTCLIAEVLSAEETERLARHCKLYKCTIHGAITAAANIAMATILQNRDPEMVMSVLSSFSVNVRRDCVPRSEAVELGCLSVDCDFHVSVPVLKNETAAFWQFARHCTHAVHSAVSKGNHLEKLKRMGVLGFNLAKQSKHFAKCKETAGRSDKVLHISNLGRHELGTDRARPFEIEGFYFAVAEHNVGPVYANNIVTINGVMHWSFVYFSSVVSKEEAHQYSNLVLETLKDVSCV